MSPRSEEFLASAEERLDGARDALAAGHAALAVSSAYYAVLYAARAALSEEDRYAKTHRGVWALFGEVFVSPGRFDSGLAAAARQMQDVREGADYEAQEPSAEEAAAVIADAERFVEAVETLLD
jgi:uncharacterized protein (UPF0332 family)